MYFGKLIRWPTIWLILLLMVIFTIISRQILTYRIEYSYLQMLLMFSMLDIHIMDYVYSGYEISSGASYLHTGELLMIPTSCYCYMDSASLLFKVPGEMQISFFLLILLSDESCSHMSCYEIICDRLCPCTITWGLSVLLIRLSGYHLNLLIYKFQSIYSFIT